MLIIHSQPIKNVEYDTFSVNANLYDSFIIRRIHDSFQLALHRNINAESGFYIEVARFEDRKSCENLFQAIIEAIEAGEKIFRVGKYLEGFVLQSDDIPTV